MKKWWIVVLLAILIVLGVVLLVVVPAPKTANAPTASSTSQQSASTTNSLPDLLTVSTPAQGATVASPLKVQGQARGNFYFEAVFPVKLEDASGKVIAQGQARAQSDWMITNYVPFVATLTFPPQPKGSAGTLVLKNDNPSGDPSKDKILEIPVKF